MKNEKKVCKICGKELTESNGASLLINGESMFLCGKHYAQYRKYKKFLDSSPVSKNDANEFSINGDVSTIYTRDRKGNISGSFKIDTEDLEDVICKRWRKWKDRYYTGNKNITEIDNFIMKDLIIKGMVIDHINHDTSDNRRSNLRIITQQRNVVNQSLKVINTSSISGVYFDKNRNKWVAEIKSEYIKCQLGRFDLIEDAAYARLVAEKQVFKEYRNSSNDKVLLETANKSRNKKEIERKITNKINNKYSKAN